MAIPREQANTTYLWRKTQSQSDSTDDGTLPCPIRSNDHIQMRSRSEFDEIVGDKVFASNAED